LIPSLKVLRYRVAAPLQHQLVAAATEWNGCEAQALTPGADSLKFKKSACLVPARQACLHSATNGVEIMKIHPAIDLVQVSGNRLQLRSPAESFTFKEASQLGDIFPVPPAATSSGALTDDLREKIVSYLRKKSVLLDEHEPLPLFRDRMVAGLDFLARFYRNSVEQDYDRPEIKRFCSLGASEAAVEFERLAREAGLDIHKSYANEPKTLHICFSDAENYSYFRQMNQRFQAEKIPGLYVQLNMNSCVLGPLVFPDVTPCYECYYHRLRSNLHFVDEFDAIENLLETPEKPAPLAQSRLASVIVLSEAAKASQGLFHLSLVAKSLEYNLMTYEQRISPILKLPRCPVCGSSRLSRQPTPSVRDIK
jgi:bacteriocin biosynthesis cyclodehydratase domain-containing protein